MALLSLSFAQTIFRAEVAPLAPVIFDASGYMKEVTAEQKILCSSKVFCLRWLSSNKGGHLRGNAWESFGHFGAGKSDCPPP